MATIGQEYLSTKEAAEYLGVSHTTLKQWRLHKSLYSPPWYRIGTLVKYRLSDLDSRMQESKTDIAKKLRDADHDV